MVSEQRDWQLQCKDLKHRGSYLLQLGLWSDCSFLVGSEPHQVSVPAHQLLLSMASPVFEAMFHGSLSETSNGPIPIVDILPETFQTLLEYIYTDTINISSVTIACGLYYAAKKYMFPYLMKKCLRYIWASLCLKNVCYVYEFAKMFELRALLETCKQTIENNASEVLQDSSFEELEPSSVLEVFSLRLRVGSELQLFQAAERRAPALDEETIRSMIKKIQFLTLTPEQFVEGPAKSPLLTKDDVLAVLMNMASSQAPLPLPDGFSACRVPRRRVGPPEKMSILDMNGECWRRVLGYVPVWDIVRSERVSRGWQQAALGYLSSVQIGLAEYWPLISYLHLRSVRWLEAPLGSDSPSFQLWCRKLGTLVAAVTCKSEELLEMLIGQCPNISTIIFVDLSEEILQKYTDAFGKLERLLFYDCNISDNCIAKFVASNEVKKLFIKSNEQMTGHCLLTKPGNIESLTLSFCQSLEFSHLSSAVKRSTLVELELHFVHGEICKNIDLLLRDTPNLKSLSVYDFDFEFPNFFDAVCKLGRLEVLYSSVQATDEDLEALARSCTKLRVLMLYTCYGMTGHGLRAACALAGARFIELGVSYCRNLDNDDVVTCIRDCPNLELLDVSGCHGLTRALLPRAAAARRAVRPRRPLNLHVADCRNDLGSSQQNEYEDLIIHTRECRMDTVANAGKYVDHKVYVAWCLNYM